MTSSQHGLYVLGYTHATMAGTMGCQAARRSQSHQSRSQFGLQAATRLHEAGVASNRRSAIRAVNTFPGLVHTARHVMGAGNT
jgi:hypothetical protein